MAFFPSLPAVTYAKDTPLCKAPLAVRHLLETEGPDVIKANYITIDEFTSDGCGMVSSILRLRKKRSPSLPKYAKPSQHGLRGFKWVEITLPKTVKKVMKAKKVMQAKK